MGCERYKESLTDAALGALELPLEAELKAHLEGCTVCRGALDAERRLMAALDEGIAASVAGEPSPEFAARVRRLVQERAPERRRFSGWVPVAAGALAAVALVAVGVVRRPPVPRGPAAPVVTAQGPQDQLASGAAQVPPALSSEGAPATERHDGAPRGVQRGMQPVLKTAEPEVLVPAEEQAALRRFCAALQGGRMDAAVLMARLASREPAELTIAPLEVSLLEPGSAPSESGRDP